MSNWCGVRWTSLAGVGHQPLLEVDHEVADLDDRLARGGHAAQACAQPGQQLVDPDRLGDVIVGAGVERRDLLALVADRREDDHRRAAPRAQLAAHVGAACRRAAPGRGSPRRAGASPPARARPPPSRRSRPRSRPPAGWCAARAGSAARRRRRGRAGPAAHAIASTAAATGSARTNVAPWPARDSAQTRPPLASANPRAIASPSPAPRPRRWPSPAGTARRSLQLDAGMPRPWSITRTITSPRV